MAKVELRESDIKEPVELFAGSSFDDALTPGSTYALFISKGAPYHLSWDFRNDVIKLDGFNDENLQALVEVTTEVYKKTSIREFREAKLMELAPYQILPEMPAIEMLCELFRTNPQNRVEFAKKIYESDMGSRQDHSEPFSSQITYLPPKVSLYREQILSLLGEPTLKCGWTYKWFCGEDKSVSEPERYVGILSVTFDKYEKATRVLYNTHESVKWVKFPGKNGAEKLSQSMWGQESHGLQCRVIAPVEVEQGMPLKTTIKLRSIPENLEAGVKQLNTFLYDEFVKLSLKNVKTHKVTMVEPYSYSYLGGPEPGDIGKNAVPLDGSPLSPWEVSFPLVRVRDALEPGLYECTVEYSFPKEQTQWWDKRKDWNSFGFWYGTVVSGPFQLKILEEIPKTKQLLVPKRLRYSEKDRKVNYTKQDAVKIEVPVRNGFFIHTFVYNNTTGALSCTGGVPIPDDINGIDNCVEIAKNRKLSYTIKVVETSVPYRHLQPPGHGSPGYKVLWEQTFTVSGP